MKHYANVEMGISMVIKNTTQFKKENIKSVMNASQFDNNKYKTFKLIYNGFGLLAGMMFVRYFIFNMMGNGQYDKAIMYIFGIAAIISLYLGMYGMDRDNMKRYTKMYQGAVGVTYNYEIDSENVKVTIDAVKKADKDKEMEEQAAADEGYEIPWDKVTKYVQDADNYYVFTGEMEALVMSKKGFIEGESKEFGELARAIMAMRDMQD